MIIGKNIGKILNFSMVKHGGAHGGAQPPYRPMKFGNMHPFCKNTTFLRLEGGLLRGGSWGGPEMGGPMGGLQLCL